MHLGVIGMLFAIIVLGDHEVPPEDVVIELLDNTGVCGDESEVCDEGDV